MTVERFFISEAKKALNIEEFLKKELDVAGFSHADVKRTPLGTRIIIHALRPGLIIGAGGENIRKLTSYMGSKFSLENPHLEVEQIREGFLDPHIVAWRLARSLEKGAYFKRSANITINRIMQAGAKGVEIRMSGKLPGARAKTWKFVAGKLRKCGQDAVDQVQVAYADAMTKPGIVGVRVAILPPEARFSDQITPKFTEPERKPAHNRVEVVEVTEEVGDEGTENILEEVINEEGGGTALPEKLKVATPAKKKISEGEGPPKAKETGKKSKPQKAGKKYPEAAVAEKAEPLKGTKKEKAAKKAQPKAGKSKTSPQKD